MHSLTNISLLELTGRIEFWKTEITLNKKGRHAKSRCGWKRIKFEMQLLHSMSLSQRRVY